MSASESTDFLDALANAGLPPAIVIAINYTEKIDLKPLEIWKGVEPFKYLTAAVFSIVVFYCLKSIKKKHAIVSVSSFLAILFLALCITFWFVYNDGSAKPENIENPFTWSAVLLFFYFATYASFSSAFASAYAVVRFWRR